MNNAVALLRNAQAFEEQAQHSLFVEVFGELANDLWDLFVVECSYRIMSLWKNHMSKRERVLLSAWLADNADQLI